MHAKRRLKTTRSLRPMPLPAAVSLTALALVVGACGSSGAETAADDDGLFTVKTTEVVIAGPTSDSESGAGDESPADVDEGAAEGAGEGDEGEAIEPSEDEQAAYDAYFECMTEEGIDIAALEQAGAAGSQDEIEALTTSDDFIAASETCGYLLEGIVGGFELNPDQEALLSDRSADMAACGRDVLGVDIPDDILLLDEDDPRLAELDAMETTPEQDAAIEACFEENLADIINEDGELINPAEEGGE